MLAQRAERLDRKLKDNALKTCIGVLLDLTQHQTVLAFFRAATECRFFPAPATLREYAGLVVSGAPIVAEAKGRPCADRDSLRGPDVPG